MLEPTLIRAYGYGFPSTMSPLDIEFYMIQRGGQWTEDGDTIGLGLFEHYKQAEKLLWPNDDYHRWSDLALETIVKNDVSIFMGPGDSNKTYSISKFILTDWWAFPDRTLWLVSSTELRGAELRIWGTLKQLFNRALEKHPHLPGRVLESVHAVTTEQIDDTGRKARLLTKGLIFIPCMSNGRYVGMGKYVGIKPTRDGRLGHVGDECFPIGTLIDTDRGRIPIEYVAVGDKVWSAIGLSAVTNKTRREAKELVRIITQQGRVIVCTPEHRLYTGSQGWKKACEISEGQSILGPYEAMQILSNPNDQQKVLFQDLWSEVAYNRRCEEDVLHTGAFQKNLDCIKGHAQSQTRVGGGYSPTAVEQQLHEILSRQAASERGIKREAISSEERREWNWTYRSGESLTKALSVFKMELRYQDWKMERERVSSGLQGGLGISEIETRHRSRRLIPQHDFEEATRREESHFLIGDWVDSVEVIKPSDIGLPCDGEGRTKVYNLAVEGHPSYSVNGFLVHNCQAMQSSFLDAYANWFGKAHFRGIMSGNPFDLEDCLCKAAEPVDGWAAWKDTEKTQTWRSRFYDAAVVAFDGRDSPNNDAAGTKFPYLIGPKKMKAVERYHGKDSWQWYNQCIGKPRSGALYKRVITRQLCESFNAFDDIIWSGKPTIKIAACDAAYGGVGGDDCIAGHIEFGESVEGNTVIACYPPVLVPVSVSKKGLPEDQIATFIKDYCESYSIPPENFFFDARATMAITFARLWSTAVNAVDFGGPATERVVSLDTFVWDGDTQTRRLQKCNELYSKFVTELWYTVHYVILSGQMRRMPQEVAEEGYKREWKYVKGNKIEVEPKRDMKQRTGHSPDRFDWLVTAVEGARRRGFEIKRMASEKAETLNTMWLENALDKHRKWLKRSELTYS